MKALLLLYILKYHLFGDDAGFDLLGAYGGLVYAVPVIGVGSGIAYSVMAPLVRRWMHGVR